MACGFSRRAVCNILSDISINLFIPLFLLLIEKELPDKQTPVDVKDKSNPIKRILFTTQH